MNRQVLFILATIVAAAVVLFVFFQSPTKPNIQISDQAQQATSSQSSSVAIHYEKKLPQQKIAKQEPTSQTIPPQTVVPPKTEQEEMLTDNEGNLYIESEPKIKEYIQNNGYKKVAATPDEKIEIYAKNPPTPQEENSLMPPMMPTIISLTAPNGEKINAVVKNDIIRSNRSILIVKKDKNIAAEVELQPSEQNGQNPENKKLQILTPPQIGK